MENNIKELKNTKQKQSIALAGHGKSMVGIKILPFNFDIMGVNNWRLENMTHFIFGDFVIQSSILSGIIKLPKNTILISSQHGEKVCDYQYHVNDFPPKTKGKPSFRTGLRAIYLALYMGYKKIYLYGYDYIEPEMNEQLKQYKWIKFPTNRIIQTNPSSRLQFKGKK